MTQDLLDIQAVFVNEALNANIDSKPGYELLQAAQEHRDDPVTKTLSSVYTDFDNWLAAYSLSSDWTNNAWHTPYAITLAIILMYPEIKSDRPDLVTSIIDNSNTAWTTYLGTHYDPNLGANLGYRTPARLARAILLEDEVEVQIVHDSVISSFEVGIGLNTQGNTVFPHVGLTPDGSFHQHNFDGSQFYWLGYGMRWCEEMIYYNRRVIGTQWEFNSAQWITLQNAYLDGIKWLFYKGQGYYYASGRDALQKSRWTWETFVYDRLIDDIISDGIGLTRLPELVAAKEYLVNSNPGFEGDKYFFNSDLYIRGRDDYYIAVKTQSTRTTCSESGAGQSTENYHSASGTTLIFRHGLEYRNARALWNARALPGTTLEQNGDPLPLVEYGNDGRGGHFAGGLTKNNKGICAFKFERENLKAHKSYMMTDKGMFAFTSAIEKTTPNAHEVWTTVNQVEKRGTIEIQNGAIYSNTFSSGTVIINPNSWVTHDGIGYYLPDGGTLLVENRSLNWNKVSNLNEAISDDIFHLYINTENNCSYAVIPNPTTEYLEELRINGIDITLNEISHHLKIDNTSYIATFTNTPLYTFSENKPIVSIIELQ